MINNIASISEDMEKGEPLYIVGSNVKCTATSKQLENHEKLNINLCLWPRILFLGMYSREMKLCPHKDMYPNIHAIITLNSQNLETIHIFMN